MDPAFFNPAVIITRHTAKAYDPTLYSDVCLNRGISGHVDDRAFWIESKHRGWVWKSELWNARGTLTKNQEEARLTGACGVSNDGAQKHRFWRSAQSALSRRR